MMKEHTMFAAEYPRLAASCPVSKPSLTSPHLPYGNPACVLSLSAAWTHTQQKHTQELIWIMMVITACASSL